MKPSDPKNEPEVPQPVEPQPEAPADPWAVVKDTLNEYIKPAIIAIAVAGTATLGFSLYKTHQRQTIEQASQLLSSAYNAPDASARIQSLTEVLDEYARTPYAPQALLELAKALFDSGKYEQAMEKYMEFKTRYPKHPLVDGAEVGRLHCLEARGQLADALAGFSAFAEAHPKHYLAPTAVLGKARCLEELGKLDEARVVYEDFIASHEESRWVSMAKTALDTLTRRIQGEGGAPSSPAPATTNLPAVSTESAVPATRFIPAVKLTNAATPPLRTTAATNAAVTPAAGATVASVATNRAK